MVTKMNGKDLKYQGYADFDDPNRAFETGKHTTIEAFDARMQRASRHRVSSYGWAWLEWKELQADGVTSVTRIHEPILIPFKPWVEAKRRAMKERPIMTPSLGYADCCVKQAHCLDEHQKTTRHFRYWCLQFPELAVQAWPWTKELIAEEVLTCRER
jgi:hypothetical protein